MKSRVNRKKNDYELLLFFSKSCQEKLCCTSPTTDDDDNNDQKEDECDEKTADCGVPDVQIVVNDMSANNCHGNNDMSANVCDDGKSHDNMSYQVEEGEHVVEC